MAVEALLDGDLARVLAELHQGLETAEHAAFVERTLIRNVLLARR